MTLIANGRTATTDGLESNFPWNQSTLYGLLPDTSSSSRIEMQNASRSTANAKAKQLNPVSTAKSDKHAMSSDILSYGIRNTSQLTAPMELEESAIIHWPLPSNSNVAFGGDKHARSSGILSFDSINTSQSSAPMESQESQIINWPLPSYNSNFHGGPGSTSSELPSTHLNPLPSTDPTWCFLSGSVVSGQTNAFAGLRNENVDSEPMIIAPRSNNLHTDGQQSQLETVSLKIGKILLNIICNLFY